MEIKVHFTAMGVPACNNREALGALQSKWLPDDPERMAVLKELCLRPRFLNSTSTTREHRDETIKFIRQIVESKLISIGDVADHFSDEYMTKFVELLGLLSPSVSTLTWVHFALWGVSLKKCGTQKHIDTYLNRSDSLEIMGSLMMTEMGHGTNVLGIETTATYDPAGRGFYLNTPTKTSCKIWAGGTVENSSHGVVFAQLILQGKNLGVHAFIVKIRENGMCGPGIATYDLGRKMGLNGVDNGMIIFDNVWIPYDNLLDRYCEITPEGVYMPKEGNKDSHKLIYRLMCQFVRGREIIAITATASLKFLTTIFYCYPPAALAKTVHRRLLADKLSKAYALEFAKPIYLGKHVDDHIRASLVKAVFSDMAMEEYRKDIRWYSSPSTQRIRQIIQDYYNDSYATTIYEGVNVVLLQMGAQAVLKEASQCYGKWMADMKTLRISAMKTAIDYAWHRNEPLYILKWGILELAQSIGQKMKGCKDPSEKFHRWSTECQMDGISLAEIYTHVLAIEQFIKQSRHLDAQGSSTAWTALCKIYSWNACLKYMPHASRPDLSKEYQLVENCVPELVAKLGPHVKYLDVLIPPPKEAASYDTKGHLRDLSHHFRAAL